MDFKVGDYVEIVHPGRHYSTYEEWLNKYVKDSFLNEKWIGHHLRDYRALGLKYIEQGMRGTIMAIAPHERLSEDTLAYFLSDDGVGYIIGLEYDGGGERAAEKVD